MLASLITPIRRRETSGFGVHSQYMRTSCGGGVGYGCGAGGGCGAGAEPPPEHEYTFPLMLTEILSAAKAFKDVARTKKDRNSFFKESPSRFLIDIMVETTPPEATAKTAPGV